MFVMCPDCLTQARLGAGKVEIVEGETGCKHSARPTECPVLGAAITAVQQVLKQSER
jgi:hypothetical protein